MSELENKIHQACNHLRGAKITTETLDKIKQIAENVLEEEFLAGRILFRIRVLVEPSPQNISNITFYLIDKEGNLIN